LGRRRLPGPPRGGVQNRLEDVVVFGVTEVKLRGALMLACLGKITWCVGYDAGGCFLLVTRVGDCGCV
jgi:hypothetical protein